MEKIECLLLGDRKKCEGQRYMIIYPELMTERLFLRELNLSDTDAIYKHFSDPEVTRFMDIEPCKSTKEAEAIIQFHIDDTGCRYGLFHKSNGELVGTCGFHCWVKGNQSSAEIGFDLSRKFWGQGICRKRWLKLFEWVLLS